MTETKLPKIALGAWAWGNDGTFGSGIDAVELTGAEVEELEELADTLGINAIRFWEKVMD